jgi:hypothetical protein
MQAQDHAFVLFTFSRYHLHARSEFDCKIIWKANERKVMRMLMMKIIFIAKMKYGRCIFSKTRMIVFCEQGGEI